MTPYRYVVFPPNRQPSEDEVAKLQAYAGLLDNRIAYGLNKRDGALAMAFDGTKFDEVIALEPGFEKLIRAWRGIGCRVEDHLAFIKDRHALRPEGVQPKKKPKPTQPRPRSPASQPAADLSPPDHFLPTQPSLADKHAAAREAIGLSGLSLDSALRQHDTVRNVGALVPYAIVAAGAIGLIATGFYVGHRMQNSGGESRKATTLRVLADPMEEKLSGQQTD